ncbi:hypothetical protein [Serratia fonticola]
MKNNILLLSSNSYLVYGIKKLLTGDDVRFFERNEVEHFINMCSFIPNQKIMIIYDKEEACIVKKIFGDFSQCLISCEEFKSPVFFSSGNIVLKDLECCTVSLRKARANEIIVSFYYLYMNYTYDEISKKISMDKRRISYVLTNYVRSQNYNNKNLFYIDNIDVNDEIKFKESA